MLTRAINEVSRALVFLVVDKEGGQSNGTGYVVSTAGHVLTCHHLVAGARRITAHFTAGSGTSQLILTGADAEADLALLESVEDRETAAVALHEGPFVPLGREVGFLGFPYSDLFQPPLVMTVRGIVGNRYAIGGTDYYVIDAQASAGFSGGPLFLAENGAVCGTVSARFDPLRTKLLREGRDPDAEGVEPQQTSLSFAITSQPALALLRSKGISFATREGT